MTGARLLVAAIPTKGTAFAEYVARVPGRRRRDGVLDLVDQEAHAKARIAHMDTLPALGREGRRSPVHPQQRGMHSTGKGYRSIGEVVAEFLEKHQAVELGLP